jgi:membrane associated rhomboid family serine protease
MSSQRDYVQDERPRLLPPLEPATITILIVNLIVFGIQKLVEKHHDEIQFYAYFALSLDGLKSGYLWQFLTYQFLHASWPHILLNSWAILIFGGVVEQALGKGRMLLLYFLSGVLGGAVQMLGSLLLPGLMGDPYVVGASAGAFGLVAAFAAMFPGETLYMLLFFVIPLKMRAITLLRVSIIVGLIGILYPLIEPIVPPWTGINLLFENIGHAAHLGGIATGYVTAKIMVQRFRAARSIQFY